MGGEKARWEEEEEVTAAAAAKRGVILLFVPGDGEEDRWM